MRCLLVVKTRFSSCIGTAESRLQMASKSKGSPSQREAVKGSSRKRGKQASSSLRESVRENLAKTLKEKNMQFRFKPVEDSIAPLIHQVTSLAEYQEDASTMERFLLHRRQFGNPKKLVQLVDKAVMNFTAVGEDIAAENPDFQEELLLACEEVRQKGEQLHSAGSVFIQDSGDLTRRATMVHAARELLFSVTRLMVIADIIDVNNLLNASVKIEEKLKALQNVQNEAELIEKFQDCTESISQMSQTATLRLSETKSKSSLQLLAASQTELNQAGKMLVSASKAFLHNPNVQAAEENRGMIIEGMLKSLRTLSLLADGENTEREMVSLQAGDLMTSFTTFESCLEQMATSPVVPAAVTASVYQELEVILKGGAELAESGCTRDYRQHTIISQSSALKEQVQTLMSLEGSDDVEGRRRAVALVRKNLTTLKQELHRVSVDHLSDAFLDVFTPLNSLVRAAEEGNRPQVQDAAKIFEDHANTMLKASRMLCSLSRDVDGIQITKMAAKHVHTLIPQVIKAAQTLVVQPRSSVLQKNMAVFREVWVENVNLLTSSVDAIAPLLDFLVVTEAHLHEDSQKLMQAVLAKDRDGFDKGVHLMKGRCSRVAHFVKTEMRENPPRYSAEKKKGIGTKVHKMETNSMMKFRDAAFQAGDKLNDIHEQEGCLRALKDTTEKVMEDVRELCREILETRPGTELIRVQTEEDMLLPPPRPLTPPPVASQVSAGSMTSLDSVAYVTPKKFERTPQHSQVFNTQDSAKSVMAQLSVENQAKLAKVAADLTAHKAEFESEAQKWDAENDIVVLAKEMCMMMMDMSDFTRGLGRLHSVMDLVVTAKDIARAGEYLCTLTRVIADQCPDEGSRTDLLAYVDRIKLHCQQLKITSAVKAEEASSMETVDSASALITAAKNLMKAVVETVKTSYIASIAIARLHGGSMPDQFTQWRLTLPRKKTLKSESPDVKTTTLIHQLGQFKPDPKKHHLML